jgi:hypothetical protein
MPTPTIPAGNLFMNATLYTGNGTALTVTNGVAGQAFQPDFVWVKSRSAATSHYVYDVIRGTGNRLITNGTLAEAAISGVTAFNSNGFAVGTETGNNGSGDTYVGWQWKAGGAAVTNTAGSISAQVSANTTAGFSVVTGTFPASGTSCTFGHGLGVAPSMIISKGRDGGTSNWIVRHTSLGNMTTKYLEMNSTGGVNTGSNAATAPSSTLASVSSDGLNNNMAFVAYCFAQIAGYSAFGSYTGNGSTDGPFVYLGFRPRFVMVKKYSSTEDWAILDSSRSPNNVTINDLFPNLANAESVGNARADLLSNGIKFRTGGGQWNLNGADYIYAAFAENPFKYANAR